MMDVLTLEIASNKSWRVTVPDDLVPDDTGGSTNESRTVTGRLKVNAKKLNVMASSNVRADVQVRDVRERGK